MKKLVTLLLAAAMILCLAACTKEPVDTDETTEAENTVDSTTNSPESDTEKETETEAESETETETEAVSGPEGDTVGEPDGDTAPTELTRDEALAIAKDLVGEYDPDLGYKYSVQFDSVDGGTYKFKVSMYIEDQERYSTCGYVLVDPEGNATKFDW